MRVKLRDFIVGGVHPSSRIGQVVLTVLRIFAGLSMSIAHGWGKMLPSDRFIEGVGAMGFPLPALFAYAAALSEFFGGLFLAAGFLSRPSASFVFATMLVAGLIRHGDDPFGTMEKALLYAAVMLVFVVLGGGDYSIDALLRRRIYKRAEARRGSYNSLSDDT